MIELNAGNMRAEFAPEFGGAVLSLRHDGCNILRPAASLKAVASDPREAACFPCVPWFSRISDGFDFDGRHHTLAPTLPVCDPEHALHGHGWVNNWKVTSQTSDQLQCRYDHDPTAGVYPFAFSAFQDFTLTEQSLSITLSLKNTGASQMPVGLGLHPFFPRSSETRLQFAADQLWSSDAQTGRWRESPKPEPLNFNGGSPLPAAGADFSYIGWRGGADIRQSSSCMRLSSNAPFAHLYAPAKTGFFCLEPITQLPLRFGEKTLSPGETMMLNMTISVDEQSEI
ncbi:aldose 1-epimerase [Hyphococcus sp.]|uniref:aldose 1-epimerase n=1 Tax=Hyphococcus sp. TaxID=2038636 RepID=UPI002087B209|nr:MAG: aldose 1-epimerase [Marinicaulis sp.]